MNGVETSIGAPADATGNIQAHLVRAAKVPVADSGAHGRPYETRRWSLFFFFRIMRQNEMENTRERLKELLENSGPPETDALLVAGGFLKDPHRSSVNRMKLDLSFPSALNAERVRRAAPTTPAHAFRNWLKVLVGGDDPGLLEAAKDIVPVEESNAPETQGLVDVLGIAAEPEALQDIVQAVAADFQRGDLTKTLAVIRHLPEIFECLRSDYRQVMSTLRDMLDTPPVDESPHGPLARMVLYEILRQGAPMFADEALPVLRSEKEEADRLRHRERVDRTPITMAFSFSGLEGLEIDEITLRSFPDAFREGMAERAQRLGDVGRSAPEHWEGELGLRSVHGFFTGESGLDRARPLSAQFWKALRAEIRLFNDPTVERGSELRAWIGLMFRLLGLEILHIELGEDPYNVGADGQIEHPNERLEHFGFRDGLSQPFVDLGLGDPLPGGGQPDRRGTWSPVAHGEIFLDQKDETGQRHLYPLHEDLRKGSTFLVFRKLEQDVQGFRAFLEQQRPNDPVGQRKLAAQLMGRWPNGTSLVHSPNSERILSGPEGEAALNDFRYAEHDADGARCPLAAHVRRANPRDTGGRNDVRHHRILRRGIAYGGPLLGEGEADDGEKRGLLFIAANARIDLQFEVVQADWLNGGEFLGQAGLGRCPISGANDGSMASTFLEAGAVAPITQVPSFVTMRGGDYFFAPGIAALKLMANDKPVCRFALTSEQVPTRGFAMGDLATPALFGEESLRRIGKKSLSGKPIRVRAAREPSAPGGSPETVAFVGRYDRVKAVLSNTPQAGAVPFSVEPYLTAGQGITRGETFLVGTEDAGPTTAARNRLRDTLTAAWSLLEARPDPPYGSVTQAAEERLDAALRRTAGARRIDLVDDLAVQAAYGVIRNVYGISGPSWLTELAAALPFSRQHVGDLPRDWIAAFRGERPADPGLKTMQVWTTILLADLIGNFHDQRPLKALARQAGSELLTHIDENLLKVSARDFEQPSTLLEAFVHIERTAPSLVVDHYKALRAPWPAAYYKDVAVIVLEILGSTLTVVPLTFGSVMASLLDLRIDLPLLLPRLKPGGIGQIVLEAERLRPNSACRVRRCKVATQMGDSKIDAGDYVVALIAAANMDRKVFWRPERFSLGEFDPQSDDLWEFGNERGEKGRDPDNYLLFGVKGSNKHCWGRDRVAMPILEACIRAAGRLQGLRKVAGPRGKPQEMIDVMVGLPARFTRIGPYVPAPASAPTRNAHI